MPFDATPQRVSEEVKIVDAMQRLLARPENWCQRKMRWVNPDGTVAYCLMGALRAVQSVRPDILVADYYTPGGRKVGEVLRDCAGGNIGRFNDDNIHADVLALLSRVRGVFE